MKTIWKGIDWLARAVIGLIAKISPKLGDACLKLWENTELVSYLFVGVATTLVNYVAYFLATRTAGMSVMAGTWTAWVIAVRSAMWPIRFSSSRRIAKAWRRCCARRGAFSRCGWFRWAWKRC